MTKITAYIDKNLQTDLNSDVIAEHLKFSKSYVQNQFSSKMGMGIQQYINRKKVSAAHDDIKNGMAPFEAAAKYCFHDYSSFYRHYKKVFGHSPREN
jgi:AraC-like DNA-binding protein